MSSRKGIETKNKIMISIQLEIIFFLFGYILSLDLYDVYVLLVDKFSCSWSASCVFFVNVHQESECLREEGKKFVLSMQPALHECRAAGIKCKYEARDAQYFLACVLGDTWNCFKRAEVLFHVDKLFLSAQWSPTQTLSLNSIRSSNGA
jgi:hypothetical protein